MIYLGQMVAEKEKIRTKVGRPKGSLAKEKHPLHPDRYVAPGVITNAKDRLTPEKINRVMDSIRVGNRIEVALGAAGVWRACMEKWRKLNSSLCAQFEQAEFESEQFYVGKIAGLSDKDIRAAQFILERRHSWHAVSKAEITGANGGPVAVMTLSKLVVGSLGGQPDASARPREMPRVLRELKLKQ